MWVIANDRGEANSMELTKRKIGVNSLGQRDYIDYVYSLDLCNGLGLVKGLDQTLHLELKKSVGHD